MKQFETVPIKVPAKNVFNLSHDVKATYNFDKLYPFLCQPVYPGDTFNARVEVFMRTMPMLAPIMHNVDMHFYFFFVPNRLLWNENKKRDWKTFITGGEDGLQNPTLPYWTYDNLCQYGLDGVNECENGRLIDYLGFPTLKHEEIRNINLGTLDDHISALPLRAYHLIWNEYFRNQNVQNEIEFSYDEGEIPRLDYEQLFQFRKKCWEKDYFTSCLPFAQRGEAVRLPITADTNIASENSEITAYVDWVSDNALPENHGSGLTLDRDGFLKAANMTNLNDGYAKIEGYAQINAGDITFTGLNVGTINDFRYCMRLQQWLENNARCGSRYIEQLLSHFGVVSSDARLQRPELLGGGKVPLIVTDVEQQSFGDGTADNVLGDLAGKGVAYGKTDGFKKYFEEHGILMGLCCIIPRTSYSQGINRVWTATDKTDWYFPEFARLGEQAVLNKEIYYQMTGIVQENMGHDDVFGYQGRFTELRYIPSSVHGEMRGSLSYWHLGRLFSGLPRLNSWFVEAQTQDNIWALTNNADDGYDPFVCQMKLDIKAVRPLPEYAVPTL